MLYLDVDVAGSASLSLHGLIDVVDQGVDIVNAGQNLIQLAVGGVDLLDTSLGILLVLCSEIDRILSGFLETGDQIVDLYRSTFGTQ